MIKNIRLKENNLFQNIIKNNARLIALSQRIKSKGGRSLGRIVCSCRGNYQKRIYRFIDFKRTLFPQEKGIILSSQYDPIRSANILLICYPAGVFSYILQPAKIKQGTTVTNLCKTSVNLGSSTTLANFPSGIVLHNITGKIARAAGCSAILIRKDNNRLY